MLSTKNIFEALDTKKKKKSSSAKDGAKKEKKKEISTAELEKAIFSQPALGISNWADDDEDEDDFTAVPTNNAGWTTVSCLWVPSGAVESIWVGGSS